MIGFKANVFVLYFSRSLFYSNKKVSRLTLNWQEYLIRLVSSLFFVRFGSRFRTSLHGVVLS